MKKVFPKKIISWALFILCVFIYSFIFSAACELAAHHELSDISSFLFNGNVLLAVTNTSLLITLLIIFITFVATKISIGVGIVSIAAYILFVADGMKIMFRNEPLYAWDLAIVGEAANIAGSIELKFTSAMILALVILVIGVGSSIFADIKLMKHVKAKKYYFNLIPAAVSVLVFVLVWSTFFTDGYMKKQNLHTDSWNQLGCYKRNGLIYSMLSNSIKSKVSAPEGYSEEKISEITKDTEKDGKEEVAPNIIIFMSEAYTDIESAESIKFSKDIDENFDKLSESFLSGRCLTRQVGGGTANSEFEVLTGLSASLIPPGVMAYTSYINDETPSIVSYLKAQGYYTSATHPYLRNFFSRETAYEQMGFDEFYSVESFEDAQRCRINGYVTDDALTDKIIELYEQNKDSGKPFFNHSVSMQNHMEFKPNEFTGEDSVTLESSVEMTDTEKGALETYASGLYLSDKALGKLVEYFENVNEPTVILFFGDHQPYITSDTYGLFERIGYLSEDELYAQYMYYSTPYLIWNNFKEDEDASKEDMSMFQLLPYMTEKLNMQRPDYYYFLNEYATYCKGFTDILYLDGEGNTTKEQSEDAAKMTEKFKLLQYDLLHGKKYCKEEFYNN